MSLLVAHDQQTFIHADAYDLERKLTELDPRLYLKYKVVHKQTRQGKATGRRYEVHRHCEDGKHRMIGHWLVEEFDSIYADVVTMAAGAAGRIDSVEDRIDKHNAGIEADNSRETQDALGAMIDHGTRLVHDRTQPKNIFRGIPGLRDA